MPRRLPVFALCAALSLPAVADDSPYFDLKASPESQMGEYLEMDGADKLKGLTRVLVPQFRVEFQMRAESSASDSRYFGGGSASASNSVHVYLKGVDNPLLQQITDGAYARFVADMAAQGIEVIGPDKLAAEPEYAPILSKGKASPAELSTKDSISLFFAPTGGRVYTLLRQTDKDRQGFVSGFSTAFEDGNKEIPKAELALSKKYGAPCLKVLLTMTPARVHASAAAAGGIIGAAASLLTSSDIKPGLTLAEESRMVFRSADHSANDFKMFGGKRFFGKKVRDFTQEGDSVIFLKQDVRVAEPVSDKGLVDTTSGLDKVTNALSPVLALTLGVSAKHEEYEVQADPARFEQVAGEELTATTRMMLAQLRALAAAPATAQAAAPAESGTAPRQ